MPDKKICLLQINPGAMGIYGCYRVRTKLRFTVDNGKIYNL